MPHLSAISIFPVKSMEPVSVREATILPSGALAGDRTFGFFDAEDKFVNGKRNAKIHLLRSAYDPLLRTLRLGRAASGLTAAFHVDHQRPALEAWLGEFFGIAVRLKENTDVGWPDDLDCPGPTLIGVSTLAEVASWFEGLDVPQMRRRFRTNLEISDAPPFWEDRLYTVKGERVKFRIGEVVFEGNNPCQRCVVPPRDPFTGENNSAFSKIFTARREATLPAWAERSRFNHFYRLAVNTIVPPGQAGKKLCVGAEVEILGEEDAKDSNQLISAV